MRPVIYNIVRQILISTGFLTVSLTGTISVGLAQEPSLSVYFELNSAVISARDRAVIKDFSQTVRLYGNEKLLVIGHADPKGTDKANQELSRRRAVAVTKEIVASKKIKSDLIRAFGMGAREARLRTRPPKEHARYRRVDIFAEGITDTYLQAFNRVVDHNRSYIQGHLRRAQAGLFSDDPDRAMRELKQAEILGGRRYSEWHLTYGVIGYMSGLPSAEVKSIFQTALVLDPYNTKARDYLGRVKARESYFAARINSRMGRIPEDPIRADTPYEAYEYLRLFKVRPIKRIAGNKPVLESWECLTVQGKIIVYHFRYAARSVWANTAFQYTVSDLSLLPMSHPVP